jgi:hypothetical protein
MIDDVAQDAAFACCSAGIGRWFWAVWASESDARAFAPPLASGFEKSADAAEKHAVEAVGAELRHLPGKWASRYRRGGGLAARSGEVARTESKPRSRLSRRAGGPAKTPSSPRLAFLYSASESERPGEVAVTRHRIVRQNARKIHVDSEPFREEEWTGRDEDGGPDSPKPRTLAVDRDTLRREGKAPHQGSFFYAGEEDGIRDVHAALTSKLAWCAPLGVKFPCSAESIKAAFRRLARTTHPDAGGDPAAFLAVEQAYRHALAYFSPHDTGTADAKLE